MSNIIKFIICFTLLYIENGLTVNQSKAADKNITGYTQLVDPFISTGGNRYVCGFNNPGATTPFGLIRLSPDTVSASGEFATNTSGYYYHDPFVLGFSHTRLCGTGAVDGGHFRVIPDTRGIPVEKLRKGMHAKLDHNNESASPGYYSISFPKLNLKAELTATGRVGLHRYHFGPGTNPRILIDVGSVLGKGRSQECEVKVNQDELEITGKTRTFGSFSGRYGGLQVYFVARLRNAWKEENIWNGKSLLKDQVEATGEDVGVELIFSQNERDQTIELAVAVSHVSVENARENLESELADQSFEKIRTNAEKEWNRTLSLVQIEGGSESDKKIFYTAMYHSFMMPTIFNDINGEYTGFDKKMHLAKEFQYYTDMSLWDTFRTTHPLYTLLDPQSHRDMLISLVKMAEQGGNLPRWPSGTGYTNSMFGAPAEIAVTEAYLKGIRGFDVETAYRVMRKAALEPAPDGAPYSGRRGLVDFIKYGYCPSDKMSGAVAKTLEYCSTDAAIARLAEVLGFKEDADLFAKRAQNYRNLWNPETQYFQPKDSNGNFSTPLKPLLLTYLDFNKKYTDDYVEGSALQWRWSVSHDAEGLVSLFKTKDYFIEELDSFFKGSVPKVAVIPNGFYWQGNQPDIHAVYLFNSAGRPDLTQKWVRWILKNKHGTGPDGLDGNDDGGTLSAWYILSSLGIYPVVGTERYELGSPLWKRAVLNMEDKKLKIIAENYSPGNIYVKRVELNGKPLDRWWINHEEISGGGILRFYMDEQPLDH